MHCYLKKKNPTKITGISELRLWKYWPTWSLYYWRQYCHIRTL